MSVHEQFAEDLALYALGALPGTQLTALQQHLEECASCRRELERLRGDLALLALSAAGPKPPVRARARLMTAITREPRRSQSRSRQTWWALMPWLATAAVGLLAANLWWKNQNLHHVLSTSLEVQSRQQASLRRLEEIFQTLTAKDAVRVTLVAAKAPPQPQGKAFYVRDRASLVFIASNLPALPPQKAYELWLIPASGTPIPAGVFKPDAGGSATVINPPLPAGVQAKAFAMTVEPEQGSATPTMPIVMMGAGE